MHISGYVSFVYKIESSCLKRRLKKKPRNVLLIDLLSQCTVDVRIIKQYFRNEMNF